MVSVERRLSISPRYQKETWTALCIYTFLPCRFVDIERGRPSKRDIHTGGMRSVNKVLLCIIALILAPYVRK